MEASRKVGIGWLIGSLLTSNAGAETRIYGALANNHVYRGTSWSDDRASASLGLDWQHPTGLYAGSNVTSVQQGVEVDAYGGFTQQFGVFALDVGASNYEYSDQDYIDGAFRELYLGGQAGPVGLSVYRGQSPFGRYWYGQVDAGWPQGPVTVELHYGLSDYGFGDLVADQFVGFSAAWRGLGWRVRFTHHEGAGEDVKFVAAISKGWTVSR